MVYVQPENFKKHTECNARKFRIWANRYQKASKKRPMSKGGKGRTSTAVRYCKVHGKFVGFRWNGHKRHCKANDITEAQFLKQQGERSSNPKIPMADIGPKGRAFDKLMKETFGILGYESVEKGILVKKVAHVEHPYIYEGDLIVKCGISPLNGLGLPPVESQKTLSGSHTYLLLDTAMKFMYSREERDEFYIVVSRNGGEVMVLLSRRLKDGASAPGHTDDVDRHFCDLHDRISSIDRLILGMVDEIAEVNRIISECKKEVGGSRSSIQTEKAAISDSLERIKCSNMEIARLEKLNLERSKKLVSIEKGLALLSNQREKILSGLKKLSGGSVNGKHVNRS
jgi:hypothetical protein